MEPLGHTPRISVNHGSVNHGCEWCSNPQSATTTAAQGFQAEGHSMH